MATVRENSDKKTTIKAELSSNKFTVEKLKLFCHLVKIVCRAGQRKNEIIDSVTEYFANDNLMDSWREYFDTAVRTFENASKLEKNCDTDREQGVSENTRNKMDKNLLSLEIGLNLDQQKAFDTLWQKAQNVTAHEAREYLRQDVNKLREQTENAEPLLPNFQQQRDSAKDEAEKLKVELENYFLLMNRLKIII